MRKEQSREVWSKLKRESGGGEEEEEEEEVLDMASPPLL